MSPLQGVEGFGEFFEMDMRNAQIQKQVLLDVRKDAHVEGFMKQVRRNDVVPPAELAPRQVIAHLARSGKQFLRFAQGLVRLVDLFLLEVKNAQVEQAVPLEVP